MKTLSISLALVAMVTPALAAPDARFLRALDKLDPKTRLEQICDLEAMKKMNQGGTRADRAKSDVISPPKHLGNTLVAKGGAYRAGGKWYQLSLTCKATPDHKTVLDFSYKTGAEIPQAKWAAYGLWK
ncbi:DUF930 domain-containing protein [Tardiphaga alba]|uniref:DUF930 domain-containing protein n=1 Tax=Tardiphaga alba TaxID=340268 RepID=A0ABX8ADE5_9BRAD|nr:DUF930 domain-containing protein [Tardiphaga alba]QUS41712.1 DUF930 domain-containing protein [Tardiphaga alba]